MYLFRLWFASLEKLLCAATHSWIGSSYVMTFKYISTSMYSMYTIRIVLRIMLIRSWICRFNNSANDGMFLGFCWSADCHNWLKWQCRTGPYDQVSQGPSVAVVFSLRFASDQVIQVIPDSSPPGHPPFPCPSFDIFYVFLCQAAALTVPNVHRVMQSVERGMALSWSKSSGIFWGSAQFWYGVVVKIMKVMKDMKVMKVMKVMKIMKVKIRETTWRSVGWCGFMSLKIITRNGFPSSKGTLPFAVESFSIFQQNFSFQPPSTSTSSFKHHH